MKIFKNEFSPLFLIFFCLCLMYGYLRATTVYKSYYGVIVNKEVKYHYESGGIRMWGPLKGTGYGGGWIPTTYFTVKYGKNKHYTTHEIYSKSNVGDTVRVTELWTTDMSRLEEIYCSDPVKSN